MKKSKSNSAASSSSAPPLPQPPPSSSPKLWALNEDMTVEILQRLDTQVILKKAQIVCKTWCKACKQPEVFRVLDLKKRDERNDEKFENMCRCAVDRSQGQLIDLSITEHGEKDLLKYITDRSRGLKRLKLHNCDIKGDDLVEALEILPQLEELQLIMATPLERNHIESIGRSCSNLKSFTYHEYWDLDIDHPNPNDHALAIAATMPNLRTLQLVEDPMENEGLEAILASCTNLESLDLRWCLDLDMEGELGNRCLEQISEVKLPSDSIADLVAMDWEFKPPSDLGSDSDSDSESDYVSESDPEMV